MRIGFIGCVEMSGRLLQRVIGVENVEVVGIVTRSSSPTNADFQSLAPLARRHEVPVLEMDGNDQDAIVDFLSEQCPDVLYCFGWSYLLGRRLLDLAPKGVVGFHPAALPRNRGRHPIIWALALGLDATASTFFLMDEGADSGPILSQWPVEISSSDTAADLYQRIGDLSGDQIVELTRSLTLDDVEPRAQDDSFATSWRKRGREDGRIDWRMSPDAIYNLVRALSRPYVGAHIESASGDVKIWRCEPVDAGNRDDEPGKVLARHDDQVIVRCYSGAICLIDHDFESPPQVGDYL